MSTHPTDSTPARPTASKTPAEIVLGRLAGMKACLRSSPNAWFSLLCFLWPFVYLCHYYLPIGGEYTVIGSDFHTLYYSYKLHLVANLAAGHFPLWSPAEAAGYPFYSSPFAQAFYPMNLLLVGWYKLFGGYSDYDHQLFTILGVAIFCLGLFRWLAGLKIDARAALFSAMVMGVSFKVTEILRFPNAVHAAAWFPWILLAVTNTMRCTSWKPRLRQGLLFAFYLFCLCTAGYPYFIYYALFLFVPYVVMHFVPALRRGVLGMDAASLRPGFVVLSLATCAAGVPAGLYLNKTAQLMALTVDRGGSSLAYSTAHNFDFIDTVGSLVYPPFAQTEGWYFFSVTALLIVLLYFSRLVFFGGSKAELRRDRLGAGVLFAWIAVISYVSYGRESHLFLWLWHHLPGFSSLRVWGRLNIVLVPLIALLLAKAYASLDSVLREEPGAGRRRLLPVLASVLLYGAVLAIQLRLRADGGCDRYWSAILKHLAKWEAWFIYLGIAAFAALVSVLLLRLLRWGSRRSFAWGAFCLLVLVGAAEMYPVGAHTWVRGGQQVPSTRPTLAVGDRHLDSFAAPRRDIRAILDKGRSEVIYNVAVLENWYFKSYVGFLNGARRERGARDRLLGVAGGRRVFLSRAIGHGTIAQFLRDSDAFRGEVEIKGYDGDELSLGVVSSEAGYLSFIDNWDPDWKVFVDAREERIELLFGTFKSVRCPAGAHEISFRYAPGLL